MSDHAWTSEAIAAYVVGGLTEAEIARVDAHVRQCGECESALNTARETDRGLQTLFALVRPSLKLEDDAVRATRAIKVRRLGAWNWPVRFAVAASVLLGLCMVGALADGAMRDGVLPMPGSARRDLTRYREALTRGDSTVTVDSRNANISMGYSAAQAALAETAWRFASPPNPGIQGGFGGGGGAGAPAQNPANPVLSLHTSTNPNFTGGQADFYDTLRAAEGARSSLVVTDEANKNQPKGGSDAEREKARKLRVEPTVGYSFKPSEYGIAAGEGKTLVVDPGKPGLTKGKDTEAVAQQPAKAETPAEPQPAARRIVVRSGDIEFEVNSFDDAVSIVSKIVGTMNGALIATVNSEKLANGKVRGSITVRTPPEHLDRLVGELRRELTVTGELKGMRIGSQDITKQYTDLESRLRAARTMEERLLQIIKDGKGEIKDLLQAEKELGTWRTRIEEFEGEIRYYSNLVSLATLTIKLTEKEIRAAASITENERVQAGIEADDVDKAYQQALAAIIEAKGRVTKSEMKQLAAGQFNASLQFEVPPESAGPMRDRLRQLGKMARLEIDRVQKPADGSLPTDAKVKRGDTLFLVQIYNLANVAPRETVTLQLAVPEVRAGYQSLREAIAKTSGRVLTASLNEQDLQNVTAQIDLEVRRAEDGAIRSTLDAAGETVSRQVARTPESNDTTDSKLLYRVTFVSANRLPPRESTTLTLEVADVEQAAAAVSAQIAEANGRQLSSQSSRDQSGKMSTQVSYEIPLAAAGIVDRIKSAGKVHTTVSARNPQAPGGKLATARLDLQLISHDPIVGADDGLWPQIRRGLAYSMTVLLTSVTWVVFGLCVVLPWGIAGYAIYRLVRRMSRRASTATVNP